ncbi:MAG: KEOPS complex subunit Pcc1 [Thermoproteus sp.]
MYEISVEIDRDEVVERVFRVLEREVAFRRGRIKVLARGDKLRIVGYAADVTSARSLVNTILRVLYVVEGVKRL